jgi:hypothetical protein
MSGFPFPGRPRRELDEPLLDAFLDERSLPLGAPEELRAVAELLAGLAGPAEPGQLAGEAAARSAFARRASPASVSPARPAWRKPSRRAVPRSARVAAALVVAAIGLGGTAAAAYAGELPGPIQDFAHHAIGAPPAHHAGHPKPHPDKDNPAKAKATARKAHAKPQAVKPKTAHKPLKPHKPPKPPKPPERKPQRPKPPSPREAAHADGPRHGEARAAQAQEPLPVG